jgi:uncharacterized delta-60 repeat protein
LLDASFGTRGKVVTEVDPSHPCNRGEACAGEALRALAIARDGKLIAAGNGRGSYFALARFTQNGTLDPSFGMGGITLTNFPLGAALNAAAVRSDGSIFAAGSSHGDFALARYTNSGDLDPSFGRGGRIVTPFGPVWATKLVSLSARRSKRGVVVRWRTASEFDARGFNVYRNKGAGRRRANGALIRATRHPGHGATYSFRDRRPPRSTRRYWLQEVTVDGSGRWLRQVAVKP